MTDAICSSGLRAAVYSLLGEPEGALDADDSVCVDAGASRADKRVSFCLFCHFNAVCVEAARLERWLAPVSMLAKAAAASIPNGHCRCWARFFSHFRLKDV